MEKITKIVLVVFIVGIFSFILSFGAFMIKKEIDCGKSLSSAACYSTYPQFLESPLNRHIN